MEEITQHDNIVVNNSSPAYGKNRVAVVRENVKRTVRINDNFHKPDVKVKEINNHIKDFRCCMCGKTYVTQKGNFPANNYSVLWKGNNGYIPICKSCCETLFNMYTDFYCENEEHALKHICAMFDWYYSEAASAMTMVQVKAGNSRISLYPSKLGTTQVTKRGTTYLDTIRDDCSFNQIVTHVQDIPDEEKTIDGFVVTDEIMRTWGRGYTMEQYQYLEEEYKDWCARYPCNTKAQEELFKNIAIAQLNIRIAQQNNGKVGEAMKTLQDLMSAVSVLPKQNSENLIADTQTFGTLLKKYEETRPLPDPAPQWKDVDGIRKYMNTWVRGGLAKALHIKNENTALYDEAVKEMNKYTVKRMSQDKSSEGMGDIIFNNASKDEDYGKHSG